MVRLRKVKGRGKSKAKAASSRKADKPFADQPTPEMQARVAFSLGPVVSEMGDVLGLAYRRRPLIETMASKGAISPDEIGALRYYRTAFDRSERSPVKSCLNISSSGRAAPAAFGMKSATPSMLEAKRKVAMCESIMGHAKDTMRGVVLEDKSFSQIAMERFGSRTVIPPRKVDKEGRARGDHREKIAPKSGRHRELIRQEFIVGMRLLTDAIRRSITTGAVEEVWVQPLENGGAIIRRSFAAPAGRYRCWGDNVLVDRVMSDLRKTHGDDLQFPSAAAAIAALKDAEDGRLRHLQPEELAA